MKDEKDENIIIEKSGKKKKKKSQKTCAHKLIKLNKDEESTTKRELKTSKIKNKLELKKQNNEIFNKGENNIIFNLDTMKYYKNINSEKEQLELEFNYEHLIISNNDDIDKREINNIPFKQALRIDKRSAFQIFISVITNEIGALNLIFYINPYSHFSLIFSIYLFELLLDFTMNCFLYTDDIVSEKYHNDGQLTILTTLSLSLFSNIASSIIAFIISKLTNYEFLMESILKGVQDFRKFLDNSHRLLKYLKIRLGFYYFLQILFVFGMTYYLFIFCTVYHQSQRSIMINYIIGTCISLATSVGLTIIITLFRILSLKYKSHHLYNTSKYLYERF